MTEVQRTIAVNTLRREAEKIRVEQGEYPEWAVACDLAASTLEQQDARERALVEKAAEMGFKLAREYDPFGELEPPSYEEVVAAVEGGASANHD